VRGEARGIARGSGWAALCQKARSVGRLVARTSSASTAPAQKTLTSARDRSTLIASSRASWDALLRWVLQGRLELKLTSDCQNGGAWIEWRREPLRCCSVSRVDGEPLSRHRMWDQAWVRALRTLEFKRDVAALVAALVAAIAAAIAANGVVRMRNCMTIALVHLMHSASCEPAHL